MQFSASKPYQHPQSAEEAVQLQQQLREQISLSPLTAPVRYLAGADISFNLYEDTVYAGIVVLELPGLTPVVHALAQCVAGFPYVPGLLSFREIPSLLQAWELLPLKPDALVVDGHGIAHPRRMGIASHFGLVTGCPSMGCAKKKLAGRYEEPALEKGSISPLLHKKEVIGWAFRSKTGTKPVFISLGNGMSGEDALSLTRRSLGKYRIPEPTRQAHLLVNRFRRGEVPAGVHWYVRPPHTPSPTEK
ncbi:deoxyribonuclease V [Cesiribacter andamanensis]|uniref:Endonuclease V n=1 Tax=Cesiribacter andamanensis AMV16 TaxID=1279009 RepID=M7NUS1_9BACT|nr:deoxyribonuclease V [Cesiribacter andamanensis]EMR02209.1 Endonuclease V [Cesiribacter andamanensis AMV16]